MALFAQALAASTLLMLVAWALSLRRADVTIADVFWGPAVFVAGLVGFSSAGSASARGIIAVVLAGLWAARLCTHLVVRGRGKGEDRRYAEIRSRHQPGFAWKSVGIIFVPQAVLASIVALPLLGSGLSTAPLGMLDVLGIALWTAGFSIETIADRQLLSFQTRRDGGQAILDHGIWRYSRHPNYFGEACVWWGQWCLALAGGSWWTIFGPIVLTLLLLRVSGIALMENGMAQRRPGYQAYVQRTSAFIPWPPKASGGARRKHGD